MGCDIHTYVEQRDGHDNWIAVPPAETPRWSAYEWPDYRDYTVFVALAGVRYYDDRESHRKVTKGEPLGLPDDLSPEVRFEMEDLHSLSHLTVDEYERRCRDALDAEPGSVWADSLWHRNVQAMRALSGEVRVVFGFDS